MDSELAGLAAVKGTTGTFLTADQTKLDGIATAANNYVHPTTAGNKHIPTAGASGQFLKYSASGTAVWAADNNTTYSVGDGGLSEINFTSADHSKLDGIATGANAYTHPTTAGNKHIPTGGSSGQFLKYSSSGTAVWASDNDTVYTHPTGDGNIHVPAYGSSTSGQLLTSTGTSSTPTWQDAPQGVSNSKLFYFGSFN